MLFSKKKQEAPPITDEARYVSWFVMYSDELAEFRKFFSQFFKQGPFLEASTKEALHELANFPNDNALFDRLTEIATSYQTGLQPIMDARGGLHRCPLEILGTAASIMLKMTVIEEMLKKKYKHPQATQLLNMINSTMRS